MCAIECPQQPPSSFFLGGGGGGGGSQKQVLLLVKPSNRKSRSPNFKRCCNIILAHVQPGTFFKDASASPRLMILVDYCKNNTLAFFPSCWRFEYLWILYKVQMIVESKKKPVILVVHNFTNYTSILEARITLLSSYPWARILPYK